MRTIFRIFVVLPLALVLLTIAVANRHYVKLSLDPFPLNDIQGPEISVPLFALMFLSGMVGVFAGGLVVWLRQGKYRRQAREAKAEAVEARGRSNDLRDQLAALQNVPSLPAPSRRATA